MILARMGEARPLVDTSAIGVLLASIDGSLPSIATLFTVIWAFLRVWEMKTVQVHVRRRRLSRRRARLARLNR